MAGRSGEDDLRALILAAGEGTRLKSALPKVLHEVGGRPMLAHVLRAVRAARLKRIYVVVGHKREQIMECFRDEDLNWIIQEEQLGTGHAVAQARRTLGSFKGMLVVLMADSCLLPAAQIRALVRAHKKEGCACTLLSAVADDPFGYGRIVRDDAGRVQSIVEQRDAGTSEKAIREINSGHYVFNCPDVFNALDRLKRDNAQGEYLLTDVVEDFARRGKGVACLKAADFDEVMGVNTRADLAAMERMMNARKLAQLMADGVSIRSAETTFIHDTVTVGPDTIIYPFTVITGATRIGKSCRIGPFAYIHGRSRLRDGTVVGSFVGSEHAGTRPTPLVGRPARRGNARRGDSAARRGRTEKRRTESHG